MFAYRKFDVEISRDMDLVRLGWPEPGEAATDSGLGCNRSYRDLRRCSWAEAKLALACEAELIARLEAASDPEEEWERIDDERYENDVDNFLGLDLAVA